MTEIYLGFASSRLYEKGGELHYDMWPAFGTTLSFPLQGPVSSRSVISNTDGELRLKGRFLHYRFRFSARPAGPDALRYSVSILGILPIGVYWGDISRDGKESLRKAFGS